VLAQRPRLRVLATIYDGRIGLARDVLTHLKNAADVELFR